MPRAAMPASSPSQEIEQIGEFAATLNGLSRPIVGEWFRCSPGIEKKADQSPVTIADKSVEDALRAAIEARFPDHGIIGEERGEREGAGEYTWVIDPIDGTRAFSCGNPLFGTLVAALHLGRPVVGIIDLPALDQCWVGVEGRPTEINGEAATAAGTGRLADARIVTTSAVALGDDAPRFAGLADQCRVVGYGGDCANYGHLASGWCDIVAESNLNAHDVMAAVPVVAGAGGCLTQWDGGEIALETYDGTALASANPALHREAITALS